VTGQRAEELLHAVTDASAAPLVDREHEHPTRLHLDDGPDKA
jgi:hypothetical protein